MTGPFDAAFAKLWGGSAPVAQDSATPPSTTPPQPAPAGGGLGGTGATAAPSRAAVGLSKLNAAQSLGNAVGQAMAPQVQQQPLNRAAESDGSWAPSLQQYATSSKKAKTPAHAGLQDAMDQGLSGADPISAVGVETAAIQGLLKRMDALQQRIDQVTKGKNK